MTDADSYPGSAGTSCFFEILDYEFDRAARYKNAVTLMFIKLGRLDEIGKDCGHMAAARLLREIERVIRDNIRRADRGFIYGKDEFMIILPNTPKDGARCMVPKLRRLIENHPLMNGNGDHIALAPQFGIASYPHDVRTRDGAVSLADYVS